MKKFFLNTIINNLFSKKKKVEKMETNNDEKVFNLIKESTDPYQILEIYSSFCVEKREINENIISLQNKAEEAVDSILCQKKIDFERVERILNQSFLNYKLNSFRLDLLIKIGKFENSNLEKSLVRDLERLMPKKSLLPLEESFAKDLRDLSSNKKELVS